jgi:hypothetical protein
MVDIPLATSERIASTAAKQQVLLSEDSSSGATGDQPADRDVNKALPLLTRSALKYQGFAVSNLPLDKDPESGKQEHFGATGRPICLNEVTKRGLRLLFLATDKTLDRLESILAPVIIHTTDTTSFKRVSSIFPASHLLQMLMICLANKTFHSDNVSSLTKEIALIGHSPIKNTDDLKAFDHDIEAYSVLSNILAYDHAFQPPKKLVYQALQTLLNSTGLDHFSTPVRTKINIILEDFMTSLRADKAVLPSAFVLLMAPHIPAPSPSPTPTASLHAMMARESLVPCVATDSIASSSNTVVQFDPAESAFFTRQDQGRGYNRPDRRDIRIDSRPAIRSDFRRDDRPASRQELRGPDRPDSRLDESRDFRPSASDDRTETSASLEDLQKLMQSLQSKLDKHVRQARPTTASPHRERAAYMAHYSDSDEIAYSALLTDAHDGGPPSYTAHPRSLGVRTTICDSPQLPW